MEGLAVLIAGAIPKLAQLAYVYLAFSFLIIFIGRVLDLPEALKKLSPVLLHPRLPEEAIKPLPLVVLSVLACAMMVAGLVLVQEKGSGVLIGDWPGKKSHKAKKNTASLTGRQVNALPADRQSKRLSPCQGGGFIAI
jgi:hypothetical protein